MKKLANILIWLAIFFVSKGLVLANYIYVPTSGNLVVGTTIAVTTATAASIEGTNLGSWRATLSDDNFHWMVGSTATGYNVQLDLDNTVLNGANALTVQTEFDLDATTPSTLVQICDWNSSILVDNATDAQCTGGGWRTLNNRGVGITLVASSGTNNQYMWQVYNGYWPTATPLTNFINSASNNKIRIRYFSGTNTTSQVAIDFLRVMLVVNPVYVASNLVNLGAGGTVGPYTNTTAIFQGTQGASDNFYAGAAGSVGTTAFFYFTFDNIKTYYGMNTILTRAETGCDTTGINYRPVIYNYTTSSWEDLSTGNIACSATDTTNAWAKNNVTIANYINNQEIRIGFYGLGAGSQKIQIDQIYIMIGSSNSDVNSCEISFGTGTAADCSRSRDLDMTGVGSSWNIAAEDESTARTGALAYYPGDTDRDATISEEASAAQIKFLVAQPNGSEVTGLFFAGRFMSGTAGTVQLQTRDYSGSNSTDGGFVNIGGPATTSMTYTDNITTGVISNGGMAGLTDNAEDYVNTVEQEAWFRLKTSVDGASTSNSVMQTDFVMVSIAWTEDANHPAKSYQFTPTSGNLVIGVSQAVTSQSAANAEGVNVGSWKGTLADDNFHWGVGATTAGIDMQLNFDEVEINGANAMIVQTELDLDSTAPNTMVQICDWVSTSLVDNAADAQCTGGGWRTLNSRNTAITTVTATAYQWQIYNGYWATTTPLTNFINSVGANNRIKLRYFANNSTTSVVNVDYARIYLWINPIYTASGVTNLGTGVTSGAYRDTIAYGQGGSDNNYFTTAGTAGSIADMAFTFSNIKTYTGMNSVVIRAELSTSATGINVMPAILNASVGTTGAWENLSTTAWTGSTTDATNAWAKNNVTIANYVNSNQQIKVRFFGSTNATTTIRIDLLYIMLGSTNTDSANCEISMGTGTSTNCTNTRSLDMTASLGAGSTFPISNIDESTNFSQSSMYAGDWDADAVVEEAAAARIGFGPTIPNLSFPTAAFFAARWNSGVGATVPATTRIRIKDYSGMTYAAGGGFLDTGASIGTTAMAYADNISVGGVGSSGWSGITSNANQMINSSLTEMKLALVTSVDAATTANQNPNWDFAMVSMAWIEPKYTVTGRLFTDEGMSAIDCTNNQMQVAATVNGVSTYYGRCVDSTGEYSVVDIGSTVAGDVLTVYINGVGGTTASTITRSGGAGLGIPDLSLYQSRIILRHEDAGPITNANLSVYDGANDPTDLLFTHNGSSIVASDKVLVWAGSTYTPGGNLTTPSLELSGNLVLSGNILTLKSGGTGLTCSASTGAVMPVCINTSGGWNVGSGTVNYEGQTQTTLWASGGYFNLGVGTSAEGVGITYLVAGNMGVGGSLTIGSASSSSIDVLDGGNYVINLFQAGGPLNITSKGLFAANTSTINYEGQGNTNLTAANYFNLGIGTSMESGIGRSYDLLGDVNVAGVINIGNPGSVNQDNLNANSFAINLTGGGNPFNVTSGGSFLYGTGKVSYQGTATTNITRMSYYNLEVAPSSGSVNFGFIGSGVLSVLNNFDVVGAGNATVDAETADPVISVGNNFNLGTGDVFSASSTSNLNIGASLNIAGTFSKNTSTLVLDTPAKVGVISYSNSGIGTSFYNFSVLSAGKSVWFDNANQTTVANNLTVTGTGCTGNGPIYLRSDLNNSQFELKVLGASSINYADIKDSNVISVTSANNSINSGNNTNWTISGGACLSNNNPNASVGLSQKKNDDTVINTGAWNNSNSIKFVASASDSDPNETLYLCIEKKDIGTSFVGSEDSCGAGVVASTSGIGVTVTDIIGSLTTDTEYHWQARIKDAAGTYSPWTSFGGNAENARDFGIDMSSPSGGTVYDGVQSGVDLSYNDGTLNNLGANWSGVNSNTSGLLGYEYSIGTGVGNSDVMIWTNVGTQTSAVATGLNLNTSNIYYFNLRTTDNAGNTNIISSNGIRVSPSLVFSTNPAQIIFSNLNAGNAYTASTGTTLTVSTNAYNGYVIRAYTTDLLRSTDGLVTIGNFNGGNYASPDGWTGTDRGFGYSSDDTNVSGVNKFLSTPCLGGNNPPCFAPFGQTYPGDIVADHTNTISGLPITNEVFNIFYRVQTDATQAASNYRTTIIYTIVPQY